MMAATTELALGFAAAAGAAACYEVSYAAQALEARSVDASHELRASLLVRLVRRPRWIAAIALALLGWGLQIVALGLAPLTLVQPTLALGLLLLLYLSHRVLGEHVGPRDVLGVIGITAGVATIALCAPERTAEHAEGAGLAITLAVLAAVTVLPFLLRARGVAVWLLVVSAGTGDALAAFVAKLVSDELASGSLLVALAFAAGAGLALLFGLTSELSALQRSSPTRVAPAVLVMQTMIPVLLAPLLVGESWGDTPGSGAALVAGFLLVAAGTAALAASPGVSQLTTGEVSSATEEVPSAAPATSGGG
jgi:drug/metabolite transporter (DMT)-like permease